MVRSEQRILSVDDDPFTRTAVAAMLSGAGFGFVSTFGTAAEALANLDEVDPTAAVVDLDLGEGPNGVDLIEVLRRRRPSLGVVILSTYETARLIGVQSVRIPTDVGYVVKGSVSHPEVLAEAIERSLQGPVESFGLDVEESALSGNLSDMHLEILRLLSRGLTNAEIASRLVVNERTVEKSIARLIKVLNIAADKSQNQRVVLAQAYLGMAGIVRRDR